MMDRDEKSRAVDRDTAKLMSQAGIKTPEVRSTPEIQSITTSKHETVAYLLARGLSNTEIAEAVGLTVAMIGVLANSERMQFQVKHLRYKLFGKDHQKAFKEILPYAIETIGDVIKNPKAKPETRLSASIYATDRILGKPKQQMEIGGSLIRKLYDKLDGKEESATIDVNDPDIKDVEPVEVKDYVNPNDVERVDKNLTNNPNLASDKWGSWADKNL
jgi:hypothetical protein